MTDTEQQFLHIVRAFARDEQINLPQDTDLTNLLQPAKIHSLSAVVGYALNHQLQAKAFADTETSRELQRILFQTVIKQTQRLQAFEGLLDRLNAAEIPVVLFKGCVVNRYYPDPAVRTFGDIDFLVREEDLGRLHEQMLAWGYQHKMSEFHVTGYAKGIEKYEVHTSLLPLKNDDDTPLHCFTRMAFQRLVPTGRKFVFELEANYHFIYLLLHIAKHMQGCGAGVRMFLDLALMLQREEKLQFSLLQEECQTIGLQPFFHAALHLCQQWFSCSAPLTIQKVSPADFLVMQEYVLSGGVFGFHQRNPVVASMRDETMKVSRNNVIKRYLFPPYNRLVASCSFLKNRRWLLPVAWLVHAYRGVTRHQKLAKHILKGMASEGDYARSTANMLKNIGLNIRLSDK